MNKKGKIWGVTQSIFEGNNVEVHRIEAKKDGYCSKHYHANKHNLFYIESGKLKIYVYNDNGIVDETIIQDDDCFSVEPGVKHRFECLEDNTVAYEIYWSNLDANDIVRDDVGGVGKVPS